jgi:hypothetical protein
MIKISKLALLFSIILLACSYSCKKSASTPTVETEVVRNISATAATCGGVITDSSNTAITARGVCWSTTTGPTTSSSHTANGPGTGTFTSELTGLKASTTYFVKAYIIYSGVTTYGDEVSFTTTQ